MLTRSITRSLITTLFLVTGSANAAFQVYEQGAGTLGLANAGAGTNAQNASIEYFNAAGMALIKHPSAAISASYIFGNLKIHPKSATDNMGVPVLGNGSRPKANALIPSLHYVQPLTKIFTFGFGITSPFGAKTEYSDTSLARFIATKSELETINLNPNIAAAINKKFAIGFGIDAQRLEADLARFAMTPMGTTKINQKAKNWAWGWNAGLIYQITPATRAGVSYRSRIKHGLKGTAKFNPTVIIFPTSTPCRADITLPDMWIFSLYHDLNPKWAIMGDVQYIHWDLAKNVEIKLPKINMISNLPLNFRNSWRVGIGSLYRLTPKWIIRGGIAFNQTPVPNNKYRLASLPDSNRIRLAIGANYKFNKYVNVDVGYAHLFFKDSSTNYKSPDDLASLVADFSASANIVGAQLNLEFPS